MGFAHFLLAYKIVRLIIRK